MVFPTQMIISLARVILACWFWLAVCAAISVFLGFLGDLHWLLDLFSHFRLVYICILLPALVIVCFERPQRWVAIFFMVALAVNLTQVVPMYWPPASLPTPNVPQAQAFKSQKITTQNHPQIKILQINVYGGNTAYEPIFQAIENTQPDVVIFEEYMTHHALAFQKSGILKQFPYGLRDLNTLNAIYTRHPFKGHMEFGASNDTNAILVTRFLFEKNGQQYPLNLITVHPERPSRGEVAAVRQKIYYNKVLDIIKPRMATEAVVVAGDFNATPWSSPFRILTQDTGLTPAYYGFGPLPTYPRYVWRGRIPWLFPLLPIDHVLINQNARIVSRQVLPEVHSDHMPTYTQIALTRPLPAKASIATVKAEK